MILAALLGVPFAAALACAAARKRAVLETLNLAAFALTFAAALALAAQVLRSGPVSLWNGFLYADALSAVIVLLTASVALVCSTYAVGYLREDERTGAIGEAGIEGALLFKLRKFYTLTPLLVFSMMLVALANNLGVMWAAIELTTLASVFLVTFYNRVTSLEAAWKYAMIGGAGLSMALFGTIVTYYAGHALPGADGLSGLNWSELVRHAAQLDRTSMRMAFVLILLGYGTKAGLAPMHTWKPDVYSEAPVPSAAILATATLNCAVYGLIRFYALASRSLGVDYPARLLLLLGIFSMALPVPFVLVQKNFRRMLAYSTIDQAGIMVTALGIGTRTAATGLLLHMTFHTAVKSMLFLSAGNIYQRYQTDRFDKIKGGIIRAMPLTSSVFFIAVLAIAGLPPFALFQSEYLIVSAAFAAGHYASGILLVLFGAGIFAGLALHAGRLVLGPGADTARQWHPWRDSSLLLLLAVSVVIGFWVPRPLLDLIRAAVPVIAGD